MKVSEKIERKQEFIQRFILALGDVSQWEYSSYFEVEGPKPYHCVCGHDIKRVYVIANRIDKREAFVGSECINHFQEYNQELFDALTLAHDTVLAKEKEAKAKAKALRESVDLEAGKKEYEALYKSFRDWYRNQVSTPDGHTKWVSREIYFLKDYLEKEPKKDYARLSSYVKWYKEHIKIMTDLIQKYC